MAAYLALPQALLPATTAQASSGNNRVVVFKVHAGCNPPARVSSATRADDDDVMPRWRNRVRRPVNEACRARG